MATYLPWRLVNGIRSHGSPESSVAWAATVADGLSGTAMAELGRARRRLHKLTSHTRGRELPEPRPCAAASVAARPDTAMSTCTASAVPCGNGGEMAPAHVETYVRDGYILVSGLLPPAVLVAAQDEMWRQMTIENRSAMGGPPLPPRPQYNHTSPHCRTPSSNLI